MEKEDIEKQYYNDEEKHCSNCKHRQIRFDILLFYCELYPEWFLSTALNDCKLKNWIPNKKLYLKEKK